MDSRKPFFLRENHLKEIRARRRMTQFRLAIETQIPQPRLSYFENGYLEPREEEKSRISEVLEVSPDEIFPTG